MLYEVITIAGEAHMGGFAAGGLAAALLTFRARLSAAPPAWVRAGATTAAIAAVVSLGAAAVASYNFV